MKCLLCPAEIDETREIPYPVGNPNDEKFKDKLALATADQRAHSAQLERWRQYRVQLDNGINGSEVTVDQGHLCPAHEGSETGCIVAAAPPKGGA